MNEDQIKIRLNHEEFLQQCTLVLLPKTQSSYAGKEAVDKAEEAWKRIRKLVYPREF